MRISFAITYLTMCVFIVYLNAFNQSYNWTFHYNNCINGRFPETSMLFKSNRSNNDRVLLSI